jgi:FkbM family methyltransferase
MTFISYAQNFEDVMLWRALKHVSNGFYIDIGAQDPVRDSVSLAFYKNGWRGVHVEPTQQYSKNLRLSRPDEQVMQVAISDEKCTLKFFEFPDTGLSTGDASIAALHMANGFAAVETEVLTISMDELLNQFSNREIHWLKIDVEGHESHVLKSWNSSDVRPWVLVVESTKPLSNELTHQEWEADLLAKGYIFAYFDGLNRYYVSEKHQAFLKDFETPPNIFDDFSLSGLASQPFYEQIELKAQHGESRAQQAESRAQQAESRAQQAESRAQQAETASNHVQSQLRATLTSRSWRVTGPLRWFGTQARRLRDEGLRARLEALVAKTVMHSKLRLGSYNKLRIAAHRLGSLLGFNRIFVKKTTPAEFHNMSSLSKNFYENLKREIQVLKKDGS